MPTSSIDVRIVVLYTISPPSVLSLVTRKSARRLVKHMLKPRKTLMEVELVMEAKEVVVAMEVELVAEERHQLECYEH